MDMFRRLMTVVLIAGTTAGLALSALQFFTIGPLIHAAEAYELAARPAAAHAPHPDAEPGVAAHEAAGHHAAEAWQPSDGLERTAYTVLGTVLTGIAFAALLFGVSSLFALDLDLRRGLWLGLAGFACFALAPAIGLPPKPPGVPGAELQAAQAWWIATALLTAVGLGTVARANGSWPRRVVGLLLLTSPHLVGAPQAHGATNVPLGLIRQFAVVSVSTQAVFWLMLGGVGSYLYARMPAAPLRPSDVAR